MTPAQLFGKVLEPEIESQEPLSEFRQGHFGFAGLHVLVFIWLVPENYNLV